MSSSPTFWSSSGFLPQGAAFQWHDALLALHATTDALLAIAYGALAATIVRIVRRRPSISFPSLLLLFATLLAFGGLMHTASLLTLWQPAYWIEGALKLLAATTALAAAAVLARTMPRVLQLPTRAELQQLNTTLEDRVAARTADLTAMNDRLRREIEQREQAEAEVRRLSTEAQTRLAEFESLFKALPVGVAIAPDPSCRELRFNQALANMAGFAQAPSSISAPPFPFPTNFRIMREGRELGPDERPMERAVAQNAPVRDFEATIVQGDGMTVDVLANAVPIRDEAGNVRGCVATFQDISVHKHAARQRLDLERKLLQSQKLESIGLLAGGIAHDFNNLLTGILGHTNFARSELSRGSSNVDHMLAQVELSAQRAAELCRQLLAYAGKGRFVVRMIDLNVTVEQAVPLLRLSITKKITLDLQLGSALPPFRGDPSQISQVLMNLIANASEAIGTNAGTITLRTERVVVTPMDMLTLTAASDMEPGVFVCLEVRDNGCGITPEALAHIFEPFFTTKFVGRGLGLAAVIGIVHGHRGGVRVTSQVGLGTTFEIFFPVAPVPVRTESATPLPSGRATVLVADDDESVRSFVTTALISANYRVVTANDGEEALAKLRADPTQFDAVLLDLTMPKLDGEDTLMGLRMLAPNLPVILTSGYSDQSLAQRFVGRGVADFLPKPFLANTLLATISAAIARSRAIV